MNIDIKVTELPMVKTLVELLNIYEKKLPQPLLYQLKRIGNSKTFEYDNFYFKDKGFDIVKVIADGVEIEKVMSINPILNRITSQGSSYYSFFKKCEIIHDDEVIMTFDDQPPNDSILMSYENPDGFKLEDLMVLLANEMNVKNDNAKTDKSKLSKAVQANNLEILKHMNEIKNLQLHSYELMAEKAHDGGVNGKPRIGEGSE